MQMESKALNSKNAEMKQAFALLLDQFQDYVNMCEGNQEGMRATIKRLSIENQRLKVNYHLEAKDVKDKDFRLNQREIDDANRQIALLTQENLILKKKVGSGQSTSVQADPLSEGQQFQQALQSLAESSQDILHRLSRDYQPPTYLSKRSSKNDDVLLQVT